MKVLILLAFATFAYAKNIGKAPHISALGFNQKYSIPLANKIRAAEEAYLQSRIVGGSQTSIERFPYQVGVLTYFTELGTGVCGGSLVTPQRVIHAAHCWYDGLFQGNTTTVVLGSDLIFFGGTRFVSYNITMHPEWDPLEFSNDVAVIYLPQTVVLSNIIATIALPFGNFHNETFVNATAVASGYGQTSDNSSISVWQTLNYVELNVISNEECALFYYDTIKNSTLCTSGAGGKSTCSGDSGGPLVATKNNETVLIGVTSFGSIFGCEVGFPAGFSRVTSFMDFFNDHIHFSP